MACRGSILKTHPLSGAKENEHSSASPRNLHDFKVRAKRTSSWGPEKGHLDGLQKGHVESPILDKHAIAKKG